MIIDDFSRPFPDTTIGTRWALLSDGVMGGLSSGSITPVTVAGRPAMRMQGSVSLENNGGFLQVALDLAPGGGAFDASAWAGVAIDVSGNSEQYGLHIRTTDLARPWESYRQSFMAKPEWQELRLPFDGFLPHRTVTPLNIRRLRRLGIVAIGRAFDADLRVSGLRLY
ncbi:MAG: CIA30 family protein [Aestuariivirga sp.]|uniref:CIA30 family protein n=1 Tax=Aestuariivirga sp. TaxID=2650926 RepID=UPI0038D1B8FD